MVAEPTTEGAVGPMRGSRDSTEVDRLLALESFDIMDTPAEEDFDALTELAAYVCSASMALVGFIDRDRRWVKASYGAAIGDAPREATFCDWVITGRSILEVPDAALDPRFSDQPMVIGEPHLRFYAGAPLISADGYALGTLSVLDCRARSLTPTQRKQLRTLADQVVGRLQLRRRARQYAAEVEARQAADTALRQQQRILDGVLNHTDVLIYAKDVDGRFVMANRALEHAARVPEGLIGGTDHDFFDPVIADEYRRNDRHIMATREWQVFIEDLVHPDGSVHTYRSTKFPLVDDSGEVIGIAGVSTDVTELDAARAAHAEAEQRWRALVEQSPGAVMVIDGAGMIAYANPQTLALLGAATLEDVVSKPVGRLIPARDRAYARAMLDVILAGGPAVRAQQGALCRFDGTEVMVEFTATAITHSGDRSIQLEVRDISELAAAHAALQQSASTDALTGLLHRNAWDAQVVSMLGDPRYAGAPMTVAVIDLDNFKAYNDTRGHTAGDALLKRFAASAAASLRPDDVMARWGGEEFVLALPATTLEQAAQVLNRLRGCVPFAQTCSVGYTAHRPGESVTETVTRADRAVYRAKSRGRDQLFAL